MKGAILRFIHGAVDIVLAFALVPARGIPCDVHVDAVMVHNRRYGVEKGEAVLAGFRHDAFGKVGRGQRARGNDDRAIRRNGIHTLAHDFYIWIVVQILGNGF